MSETSIQPKSLTNPDNINTHYVESGNSLFQKIDVFQTQVKAESFIRENNLSGTETLSTLSSSHYQLNNICLSENDPNRQAQIDNTQSKSITSLENVQCIDFQTNVCNSSDNVHIENNVQEVLMTLAKRYSVIELNQRYITIQDNKFFCEICHFSIEFNRTKLIKHCFSLSHNGILAKNTIRYFSTATTLKLYEGFDKFDSVLSKFEVQIMLLPHLKYISNCRNNFFCLLCNEVIFFTECGKFVKSHFFSARHLHNSSNLNLNITFGAKTAQTNLNALKSTSHETPTKSIPVASETYLYNSDKNFKNTELLSKNLPAMYYRETKNNEANSINVNGLACQECVEYFNKKNVELLPQHKHLSHVKKSCDIECHKTTDYVCSLCHKILDIQILENNKELAPNVPNTCRCTKVFGGVLAMLKHKYFGVELNEHYVSVKDNNFFCEVCQIPILYTDCGKLLREHFYSRGHNQTLTENARNYIASIEIGPGLKHVMLSSEECSQMFKTALNNILIINPFSKITPSFWYISHNEISYVCHACNDYIIYSRTAKNVRKHFLGKKHKRKTFEINCNISWEEHQCDLYPLRHKPETEILSTELNISKPTVIDEVIVSKIESSIKDTAFETNIDLDLLMKIFELLPDALKRHYDFFTHYGNVIECRLCNYELLLNNDLDMSKVLTDHILQPNHESMSKFFTFTSESHKFKQIKSTIPSDICNENNYFESTVRQVFGY